MASTVSLGLLIGLGLRIILARLVPAGTSDDQHLLLGVWQGVLLFSTLVGFPHYLSAVSIGVVARYCVDLVILRDALRSATSLLGVVLGALLAGVCAQLWDWDSEDLDPVPLTVRRKKRQRLQLPKLHLDVISEEGSDLSSIARKHTPDVGGPAMEVIASLRARAAAAAGDRRRFQEERKWAISQGNWARVSQLGWQVRRYDALRDSFEREAKRKTRELRSALRPSSPPAVLHTPLPSTALKRTHAARKRRSSEPTHFSIPRSSSAPPLNTFAGAAPALKAPDPLSPILSSLDLQTLSNRPVPGQDHVESQPREPLIHPRDHFQRFPRSRLRTESIPSGAPGYGLLNLIDTSAVIVPPNVPGPFQPPLSQPPPQFQNSGVTLLAESPSLSPILLVTPQARHIISG